MKALPQATQKHLNFRNNLKPHHLSPKQNMLGRTLWFPAAIICCSKSCSRPASDTRKGNKQKKHLEILYPTINIDIAKIFFQGDLQKALGQVASGKCLLQESLPTPNFLKCFQKLLFFSGNIFFLISGEC